mmetsp:Transcript_27707/g.65071  ORF Transcript_27707/g.65071 Transcript_27707/m.65071 type:complete len:460 (-) Transcript_27707:753-2132(-)
MRSVPASEIPSAGPPDASFPDRGTTTGGPKRPSSNGTTNPVHAMIAGYMAGTSGTMVGYPLDSLKVWVQTNSVGQNKHLGDNGGGGEKKKKKTARPKDPSSSSAAKNREKARGGRCSGGSKHGSSNWWHASSSSNNKKVTSGSSSSSSSRRSNSTRAVLPFQAFSSGSPTTATTVRHRAALLSRTIAEPLSKAHGTIRALYSGVTGPLVTVGMVQSVNFATYDATRRFLYRRRWKRDDEPGRPPPREYLTKDSLWCVAASGSVGGMATAVLTAPLLMIKIRQQITGNGFRTAFREVFFVERPSSSSSGERRLRFRPLRPYGAAFVPHAMSEAIGRAIYVTTYEGLKRAVLASKKDDDGSGSSLSLRERMLCAAGSGILCWGTFFPLDALRNRMYDAVTRTSSATSGAGSSILETVRAMRTERAFYRGYSISMLRAGPVAAAVLPVYDTTLETLSSWTAT